MLLKTAVTRSLNAMAREPLDEAAVELAKKYAAAIDDDPSALRKLGPHLLETLAELGMTPKARNSVVKGGIVPDGDSDKITELRSRRINRAAALD